MRQKVGDRVILNFPASPLHGQVFEVTRVSGRHQFVIGRLLKRVGDYRKDDELRFTGTLLAALEPSP